MNRLKVEIVKQFDSQRRFAKATGIHESTVSNIVSLVMAPSEIQQGIIEKFLGLSWEELMKEI
jgi:hypothetical protein